MDDRPHGRQHAWQPPGRRRRRLAGIRIPVFGSEKRSGPDRLSAYRDPRAAPQTGRQDDRRVADEGKTGRVAVFTAPAWLMPESDRGIAHRLGLVGPRNGPSTV